MRFERVRRPGEENTVVIQVLDLDEMKGPMHRFAIVADRDIHVVVTDKYPKDWETIGLLFGPLENGERVIIAPKQRLTWPRLLHQLNLFSTVNEAARYLAQHKKDMELAKGYQKLSFVEEIREDSSMDRNIHLFNPVSEL
jgi:hypothetical protein